MAASSHLAKYVILKTCRCRNDSSSSEGTIYSSISELNVSSRADSIADNKSIVGSLPNVILFLDPNNVTPQTVLESVLQLLFDTLLHQMVDTMRQYIFIELRRLACDEFLMYRHDSEVTGGLTKQETLSVFRTAEERNKEFPRVALNRLINLHNAPVVTNSIITYINTCFSGKAVVSVNRLDDIVKVYCPKECPRCSIDITASSNFTDDIKKLKNRNCVHHNNGDFSITKVFIKNKRYIASLFLGIVIGSVSIYCLATLLSGHLKRRNVLSLNVDGLEHTTLTYRSAALPRTKLRVERGNNYTIVVQSYSDYQNAMFKIPINSQVHLTLSLKSTSDWPDNAALGNAHMVTQLKLEGEISASTILHMLKGMVHLKSLTIINTDSRICQAVNSEKTARFSKLNLVEVSDLILQDTDECTTVYRILSKFVVMKNLQNFRILSGIVSQANLKCIQRLIQNAANSITVLDFSGTKIPATIFDSSLGTLTRADSVLIDFVESAQNDQINYIDRGFHDIFPNTRAFISTSGYLLWDHLKNLALCKNISKLTIGILIPEGTQTAELFEVLSMFPALKAADLSFYFVGYKKGCRVIGVENMKDHFDTVLTFRDNCPPYLGSDEEIF